MVSDDCQTLGGIAPKIKIFRISNIFFTISTKMVYLPWNFHMTGVFGWRVKIPYTDFADGRTDARTHRQREVSIIRPPPCFAGRKQPKHCLIAKTSRELSIELFRGHSWEFQAESRGMCKQEIIVFLFFAFINWSDCCSSMGSVYKG